MGKKIIPPDDPARLARVMDEKRRLIGVSLRIVAHPLKQRDQVPYCLCGLSLLIKCRWI